MFLNEKAWNAEQDNKYAIIEALKQFVKLYQELLFKYHVEGVYVPENQEMHIRTVVYPLAKWLAEIDIDCRRSFLRFWEKRITYKPEEEYEFLHDGERIEGATEAVLSDSFVISPCLTREWEKPELKGEFYSLNEDEQQEVTVPNLYRREQLAEKIFHVMIERHTAVKVQSYAELWRRREDLFSHLEFCPSVEKDLNELESAYINQVVKKLVELERYCANNIGKPFNKNLLSKTTTETDVTLKQFKKEHTFFDSNKVAFLASWHMRFTGIPGRIFFIPDYSVDKMLICYIGEKLKNVKYN